MDIVPTSATRPAATAPATPTRRIAARLTGVRLPRRLVQLYVGLLCYGASSALMVRARLGLDPWDVFHQGLARRIGLPIGWIVIGVGVLVLLLWIPLRQKPGLGTVSNAVLIGLALDATLRLVPAPDPLWLRWVLLLSGVALNGVATGMYIGARFGPGPRDGLMTGLAARGHSVRVVRTGIELAVLAAGFLLGGQVGLGTLIYAVSIGPLAHLMIPLWTVPAPAAADPADPTGGSAGQRTG
ncbi:membrane protein [Actinocatenispora thailandica]|uniref:Membrane protein n=1 Tax=Actinocatenispora thailandica TaxID=227318 RepID=A0A7R7DP83_9ACTN|nr:membrane protein [Actinocatenispora thailandica]